MFARRPDFRRYDWRMFIAFSFVRSMLSRIKSSITKTDSCAATPSAKTVRIAGPFVILRVHIGERGHVKATTIKISCGKPHIDLRAVTELSNTVFPVPRVGRKAVAQWHVMRWEVPPELQR